MCRRGVRDVSETCRTPIKTGHNGVLRVPIDTMLNPDRVYMLAADHRWQWEELVRRARDPADTYPRREAARLRLRFSARDTNQPRLANTAHC